jgi:hypothetical protein
MPKYTENDNGIIKALGFLSMLYPRFELSQATLAAYVKVLGDLPAELIQAAAQDIGSRSTFFPAAAELRAAAFQLVEKSSGLPTAYEAWGEVMKGMRTTGSWGVPEFSNPLIMKTVNAIGGWRLLCMSENNAADRARFVAAYDIYVKREQYDTRMLPEVTAFADQLDTGNGVQSAIKELMDGKRDELPY